MAATADGQGAIFLSSTDFALPKPIPQGLAKYVGFRDMAVGGTGRLRSCFDQITGRTVVIKTLQMRFILDKKEERRLLREARVTAQLQHPNTVPVYEIGDDPKEGIYFAMKRVSGENLFQILRRVATEEADTAAGNTAAGNTAAGNTAAGNTAAGNTAAGNTAAEFPLYRRVAIVADAAQALMYAHARGVIHRDVKPENIWVGNFGEVLLLDWGVAKVWGQPDDMPLHPTVARQQEHVQELTMAGERPGTPLYMSPEQVNVNRAQVDERSDIFSVGVVLYETAALREPFRGRVIQETFENIIHDTPMPPSERSPEQGIPKAFDDVVMKAIAKTPTDRFQTMRQLLEALREVDFGPHSHGI
jgi:eukaryotic-like serine/threonine-protein kinase